MKRICMFIILWVLLSGTAMAALEYDSFRDDQWNAGRFDRFAWDGEYVYWADAPEGENWEELPSSLYRMRPGEGEAQLILQGGEDRNIQDIRGLGNRLLLTVNDMETGETWPALVNPDGSAYRKLPGNIGSVAMCGGLYNNVDNAVYYIPLDSLKPERVYSYTDEWIGKNPTLVQCVGMKLYFVTDEFKWYELDLQFGEIREIAQVRGDGFVRDYKLYISDYDRQGTWRYDLYTGERQKISDHTYTFSQGMGDYVRAVQKDAPENAQDAAGVIFDLTWMWDSLDDAKIGSCDSNYEFLLGGGLMRYDWENNRVSWSDKPAAKLIQTKR